MLVSQIATSLQAAVHCTYTYMYMHVMHVHILPPPKIHIPMGTLPQLIAIDSPASQNHLIALIPLQGYISYKLHVHVAYMYVYM
jgi:hypothetical protein